MSARRDPVGPLLGLVTFLGGIALLGFTFLLAFQLFSQSPNDTLGLVPGKPLDPYRAGESLLGLVARILLLAVMCLAGSVIANRGIKLYSTGRHVASAADTKPMEPEKPDVSPVPEKKN